MKKSKITAIFFTVLILATFMAISVSAAGTAQLLNIDETTRGDWVGNYGSEGHIVITDDDSLQSIPSYAKIGYANENDEFPDFWTWYDSDGGFEDADPDEVDRRSPSALFKTADKNSRLATCYYSGTFFTVTVDIGSETKVVSLYTTDYDEGGRSSDVIVYDDSGKEIVAPFEVYGHEGGWYLRFKVTGKVQFMFESTGGPNTVISGIFFDPDPDAVVVEEVAVVVEEPAQVAAVEAPVAEVVVPVVAPAPVAPSTGDAAIIILLILVAATSMVFIKLPKRNKI